MRTFDRRIFRAYDIRGDAARDLSDGFATDLGRAVGSMLAERGERVVVVGRDCRESSQRLREALIAGLVEAGLHVLKIEVGPSPLLYFAVHHLGAGGGVMVTGSHNPPGDNGFKVLLGRAPLNGDGLRALADRIVRRDFVSAPGGRVDRVDVAERYVAFMVGNVVLPRRNLRVVVDAGNGAGGPLALAALWALGIAPEAMHCEMDGRFPNHHPDPAQPANLVELAARVRSTGADLGIAYDADADRLGAVGPAGEVLGGDALLALFGRAVLARHPGATIVSEVKCSQAVFDDLARRGARVVLSASGHAPLRAAMHAEGALLGGELSGHLFFADRYYGYDDAIYASLRLLEIVASTQRSVSELVAELPQRPATPELRVPCHDAVKFDVVRRVADRYRGERAITEVDGARIHFGDGWGLVRASNTQAAVVLRFEADTEERRDALRAEVESVLAEALLAALEDL